MDLNGAGMSHSHFTTAQSRAAPVSWFVFICVSLCMSVPFS